MEAWLSELHTEDRLSLVALLALCFLLLIPPFYLGGNGYEGQSFLFLLAGPIAYFAWRSNPSAFARAIAEPVSGVFFLLLCAMAFSLVPSTDRFTSFVNLLQWISCYVGYIAARTVVDSQARFKLLSGTAILSATVLAVIGWYGVLTTNDFGYVRLASVFEEHNAFGGFLLLPLALLVGSSIELKSWRSRAVWWVLFGIVGSAFILTFSRGSWLSIMVSLVVVAIICHTHLGRPVATRRMHVGVGVALILVGSMVFGTLQFAAVRAVDQERSVTIFSGETFQENALTARLYYYKDALSVIEHNPLFGVGLRHYGEAVALYKDTPAYYASNPHNFYLLLVAETGLLGGLLFITLAALFCLQLFRIAQPSEKKDKGEMLLRAGLLVGCLAVLFDIGMEVTWGYAASSFMFFVLVGAGYGSFVSTPEEAGEYPLTWLRRYVPVFVLFVASAVSVWGCLFWLDSLALENGLVLLGEKKYDEAIATLEGVNPLASFDFASHYVKATVYEQQARSSTDPSEKKMLLSKGLVEIAEAIRLKPEKALFYSQQALLYKELGEKNGYRNSLEMTVRFNPVEGVYDYGELVALYNAEKDFNSAIVVGEKAVAYYPPELYTNPYWINPDKQGVWRQVSSLYLQLSIAYAVVGDVVRAKEAAATAREYATVPIP